MLGTVFGNLSDSSFGVNFMIGFNFFDNKDFQFSTHWRGEEEGVGMWEYSCGTPLWKLLHCNCISMFGSKNMKHLRGSTRDGDRTEPPDMYPPDTYPLDNYPLDIYPLGHLPPGHLPPGHLPPGHLPPRTYTPQDIYPPDFKMPYLVHASCVDYIQHFKKHLFCRNSIYL